MFQAVTDSLAIGNVVSSQELNEIAQQNYQTIIDLCTPNEGNLLNKVEVKNLGFHYINIPVYRQDLRSEILQSFKAAIQSSPKPIYIRCASGLRAGVMTLLTLAEQQNWSEQEYLEKRKALGLQHKPNCPLETFAQAYFSTQSSSRI